MKKVIVIGAGFAGLSAASCLAKEGFEVTVLEKNASAGGRARVFESSGFRFDMGPSWYWMPDVFEKYFNLFGKRVADLYTLQRLDPSYRVFFSGDDFMDIPAGVPALLRFFEKLEPGSGKALEKFLDEGSFRYAMGMDNLVYKPGSSWRELADRKILSGALKLNVLQSHSRYVRKFFRDPRLIAILEFPVLFLGASSRNIPALYSLMNYADMALGTWYPMGGMYRIIGAMVAVAEEQGVKFRFNSPVSQVVVDGKSAVAARSGKDLYDADFIVAGADYRHVEKDLLPAKTRRYSEAYWQGRTLAPSSLIFYVGVNRKLTKLQHHNLFFDEDINPHIRAIYDRPEWPAAPQFYVCCPSRTDPSVAPPGSENLFILIPVAAGLKDEEIIREKYFSLVISRIEKITGESIAGHVVFKRSYAHNDFISDYNAYKGNAYGLANTLFQTANLKPELANKNLNNFFYTGQLTVPGPGVPPTIISGQVAAAALIKKYQEAIG